MKIRLLDILAVTIIVFIIGVFIGQGLNVEQELVVEKEALVIKDNQTILMKMPAVNVNDTGVSAVLTVSIEPGTGMVLMNINNILIEPAVEHSIRIAVLVASDYINKSLDNVDITYDIKADASLLEGPSGGAAFAIATIAALENKELKQDAMITGTINHDGSIGVSGRILAKAEAAKNAGAKIFLVPLGASKELNYTEQEFCYKWGKQEYCQPEYVPSLLDISKEVGIEIKEVSDINEAIRYFW